MNKSLFLSFPNGSAVKRSAIPRLSHDEFRAAALDALHCRSMRISSFFHADGELFLILLDPKEHLLNVIRTNAGKYPALTPDAPAFHWFERELHEQTGLLPEGHPWLKPIRFERSGVEPGVTNYFTIHGDSAHEVAVGPVHAGVIEPGHFRFQCMGEDVFSLEIELGYQHRGVEDLLAGGPSARTLFLAETAAGDSSASAAFNAVSLLSALRSPETVSPRGQILRTLALELERIANHTGDLGALAGDVAFLTTSSYCGRIRGDFLNLTASLCGNRFGRGFIQPGGTAFDLPDDAVPEFKNRFDRAVRDLENALALMFDSPGVLDRFENTGCVSHESAQNAGLVGVAGRASGLSADVRRDLPYLCYSKLEWRVRRSERGDVLGRASVRKMELEESVSLVRQLLNALPDSRGNALTPTPETSCAPDTLAVSVVEAWRGELCHAVLTDAHGKFLKYKIVDPSFHNWFGLSLALRDEQISNFPICNKSFNLSYCGHDL